MRSVLRPLQVAADVVPLIGWLVGGGLSLAALLIAAPTALVTIALGWIFYRPLPGIALLVAAVAVAVWLLQRGRARAAASPGTPGLLPPPPLPPAPPPAPAG